MDLFEDEIFVFTPKGEVISLRAGSTPLDFAYTIHTEVGNHCVGAKVNGMVVPLTTELEMGDRIEMSSATRTPVLPGTGLQIVVTPSARSKIKRYFSAMTKRATTPSRAEAMLGSCASVVMAFPLCAPSRL